MGTPIKELYTCVELLANVVQLGLAEMFRLSNRGTLRFFHWSVAVVSILSDAIIAAFCTAAMLLRVAALALLLHCLYDVTVSTQVKGAVELSVLVLIEATLCVA